MRILQTHNYYRQAGGEDTVVAAEFELLSSHGHEVAQYCLHNDAVSHMSPAAAAVKTIWNSDTTRELRKLIALHRPDIIHSHNTFPLISPSLYYAAHGAGIPVVQTLHNYRLLCPAATFFRDGRICEDCLGRLPAGAVIHACYRGSRPASAAAACMLAIHRAAGTWRKVDTYIALTSFAKTKFVAGGLPERKIRVKPNFLSHDPGPGTGDGGYALFAGRLARDKGILTLLNAWSKMPGRYRLKIAGDGPLKGEVTRRARGLEHVEVLGRLERDAITRLLQSAALLMFPSEWYEGMPMAMLEAFACGTPCLASGLESLDEMVTEGENGARFTTGDASDLAEQAARLLDRPDQLAGMRRAARARYESRFTASANYPLLMEIYRETAHAGNPSEVLFRENTQIAGN